MKNIIIKFLLLFVKEQVYATPNDDFTGVYKFVYYKSLFGDKYVTKTVINYMPPQHYNCRCASPNESL